MRAIIAFRADDELRRALREEASRRSISTSEYIRDALDQRIGRSNAPNTDPPSGMVRP